jgi:DNA repair protein RadC
VGTTGLGDNELLALVLGSGSTRLGALDMANLVLAACGGLPGLARIGRDDLRRVPGVGEARAARMVAAVELGRRTLLRSASAREPVRSPREAALILLPQFGAARVEQFGVMLLDAKHRLIRTRLLSVGTLDSSVVHPREVFREAAAGDAASIVLFHNHPSGDPTPSRDDFDLTHRLVAAGDLMGIQVSDHVILADTRYWSFREAERLRVRGPVMPAESAPPRVE